MASGRALSGIVAFGLFSSPALAGLFFQIQAGRVVGLNGLGWVAILAPMGLLLLVSFRAARMSVGSVQAVYWAVTALMGVSLLLLLFRYTGASVARTFFVTAAAFGALSLYGYTTKRDLTAMGKFLFMGVIGLILAGLVNMIWPSGTMSFIISAAGVLIFSGLIAYDTQKIKDQYSEAYGTEAAEKIAIFGALFANLAVAILVRRQKVPFRFAAAAAILIATMLAVFFVWTYPTNQATANWTVIPANWAELRAQWEYSHAASAILTFAALCCSVLAQLTTRD